MDLGKKEFSYFKLPVHHITSKMVFSGLDKDLIATCYTEKVGEMQES